jgi:general stress protein YciG
MSANNKARRCKGKNKSGKPCGAAATAGGLCYFHANPDKASELGRKGGRQNRHTAGNSGDPLPTLDNAQAVLDTLARLISDVYSGKIHPRIASSLAPLLNLQLRAIEIRNVVQVLENVEAKSSEDAKKNGGYD